MRLFPFDAVWAGLSAPEIGRFHVKNAGNSGVFAEKGRFLENRLTGQGPPHIHHPLTATPPCAVDAIQCFLSSSGRSHPDQFVGEILFRLLRRKPSR